MGFFYEIGFGSDNIIGARTGKSFPLSLWERELFLHDLQHFHGAGLDTDAAGNALGSGALRLEHHHLHGAGLHALAAANAVLLVNHVHAGLGILGNGPMLTGLHALAALDAHVGLGSGSLGNNSHAAVILVEFLIKCFGTGADTFQTRHALRVFFNRELFHDKMNSFMYFEKPEFFLSYYNRKPRK